MTHLDEVINDIIENNKSKLFYTNKYPTFFEQYPVLSDKIFEQDFDFHILSQMMEQKNNIVHKDVSEHDASVKIGSCLVDKYVKPLLNINNKIT